MYCWCVCISHAQHLVYSLESTRILSAQLKHTSHKQLPLTRIKRGSGGEVDDEVEVEDGWYRLGCARRKMFVGVEVDVVMSATRASLFPSARIFTGAQDVAEAGVE